MSLPSCNADRWRICSSCPRAGCLHEPLFDWIILDSSPVIPVSDATLVAGACDGIIMVVRSNVTPSDVARKAREEFPDKLLLGVVLNGTPSANLAQSKYYYGEAVSSPA